MRRYGAYIHRGLYGLTFERLNLPGPQSWIQGKNTVTLTVSQYGNLILYDVKIQKNEEEKEPEKRTITQAIPVPSYSTEQAATYCAIGAGAILAGMLWGAATSGGFGGKYALMYIRY